MPITSGEIEYRLSGGSGNSDPAASLGGVKSSTAVTGSTALDAVSAAESAAGDVEYRCIYVHNADPALTLTAPVIWLQALGLGTGHDIALAVGTSAVNGTEQTVANESTAPSGVTWDTDATSKANGVSLGNIPAGQHRAVWIRRTVGAASPASANTFTLRVEGETGA